MTTLKLLGKASSINVRKVLWLAHELSLPLEREDWGSGFQSTRTPEFLALNPNGLVPVLLDQGFVLWESNSICRYLAARQQRADLLPAPTVHDGSLARRARVEQWMDWQAGELNNAWRYVFMARVRKSPAHRDEAAIAASESAWHQHMSLLEAQLLSQGPWVMGADFTLADIVLGLSVNRWRMTPMQRPRLPAVEAYHERLMQRPGYRAHGANGLP